MPNQFKLSDAKFDTKIGTNHSYSVTNATRLGIPPSIMVTYGLICTSWDSRYAVAKETQTASPADHASKNEAKVKGIDFLRPFVKLYYYDNPAATPEDIRLAALMVHSTAKSKMAIDITEIPVVDSNPLKGRLLNFVCKNSSGKKAKPKGMVFFRARIFVGINPPSDPSLFHQFKDFNKHPIQLAFTPEESGQLLTIAFCYVTKDGPECSYSFVITTTVP